MQIVLLMNQHLLCFHEGLLAELRVCLGLATLSEHLLLQQVGLHAEHAVVRQCRLALVSAHATALVHADSEHLTQLLRWIVGTTRHNFIWLASGDG